MEGNVPVEEPLTVTFVNQSDVTHWFSLDREVDEATGWMAGYVEDLLADLDVRVDPTSAVTTDQGHHVAGCYYEYGFQAPVTVE